MSEKLTIVRGEDVTVTHETEVQCTCGARLIIGWDEAESCPVTLHSVPHCQDFEDSDFEWVMQRMKAETQRLLDERTRRLN